MTAGLSPGLSLMTSWYDIWQQAVALSVLCAHKGKNGHVFLSGTHDLAHHQSWKLRADKDPLDRGMIITIHNSARQSLTDGASNDTARERRRRAISSMLIED